MKTYYLAKHDGTGWWILVATERFPDLQAARAFWPQANGVDYKILLATRNESDAPADT